MILNPFLISPFDQENQCYQLYLSHANQYIFFFNSRKLMTAYTEDEQSSDLTTTLFYLQTLCTIRQTHTIMAIKIISDKVYQTRKMCYPQIEIDFCYSSRRQKYHVGNSVTNFCCKIGFWNSNLFIVHFCSKICNFSSTKYQTLVTLLFVIILVMF